MNNDNSKVFMPNVNCIKTKSYRQRNTKRLKVAKVKECKHSKQLDRTSGEIACTKCGLVCDTWFMTPKEDKGQESNLIIWNRNYDKSRWTTYTLDILHGKSNHIFTDQLWLELCREVPDPFRWYDVYKVFQKYKLLKYWMAFGHFIGLPVKLNKEIINFFNENVEMGHGKYCISYMFLLYKFTQMFGEEGSEQYIPLKYSQSWCKKTDHWWEFICLDNDWEFKPTKVYKIKWNKEQFLKKFAHYVRDYLTATLTKV